MRWTAVKLIDSGIAMAVDQKRVNVPFGGDLALPVSISWATASELIDDSRVTGQVGFSLDG